MASTTRKVSDIQGDEKRSLEHLLGEPLQDDQKVFIMVYREPDPATRAQAFEDLKRISDKAAKHAHDQGLTDEDIGEAVDEAIDHVRRRGS